jgi:AraC family transcriptional regulator
MHLSPEIEWHRLGSRRSQPVEGMKVILSSGERWRGLRLDLANVSGPGELPEGILKEHALVSHVDGPAPTDVWFAGKRTGGDCRPGDVCVLPAGLPYAVRRHGPGRLVIASVSAPLLDQVAGEELAGRRVDLQPAFCARDALMTQLLQALTDELLAHNPGGPLYAETLGAALTAHVLRRYAVRPEAARRRGGLNSSTLRAVTDHIEAHLDEGISLHDLAELAEMSDYRFARRFRDSTGLPPHQYVLRRRIERAKALLRRKDLSILEVALSCGFSSQSHFAGAFRALAGVTPRGYRQSL